MMLLLSLCTFQLYLLILLPQAVAVSLASTGQTLMLADVPYYVPATPYTTVSARGLESLQSANGLAPVTVVSSSSMKSSSGALGSIVGGFTTDDVWNTGFLEGTPFDIGSKPLASVL